MADALTQALNKVGDSLINKGIENLIVGISSGNWMQAGMGGAQAGIGLLMKALGQAESEAHKRRMKQIEEMKKAAEEFKAMLGDITLLRAQVSWRVEGKHHCADR